MNFNNYNTGGTVADNSSEWKEVSKNNPCPLCGKPDWCSVSSNASAVLCRRTDTAPHGWKKIKDSKDGYPVFVLDDGNSVKPSRGKKVIAIKPRVKIIPLPTNCSLVKLTAIPTDIPKATKSKNKEGNEILITRYEYTSVKSIIREQWIDETKPKGYAKKFKPCRKEIDDYGSPNFIYNKGDELWGAYRIEEVLREVSNTDGTPMVLFQEGEGCVEIARSLGIASTCVDGSGWTTEGLTFAINPIREIGAGIIYLADNDVPGNKKAKQVEDVCNTLQIPCIVIKASTICAIAEGGDIKEIMQQLNKEDFIERLQNEIHRAVESRSVVSLDGGGDGDDDKIPQSRLARHFSLVKEEWGDKLRFNKLTKEVELAGNELNEDDVRLTMALDFDIDVSNADAHSIINRLAKADEYSPVVEYLDAISQKYNDIDPSFLDGLSLKYFGSSEPMHAIYLRKFLVGAIARARNPGCKLDTVLMLVGAQGCGKSAFLENLFSRRFFSDQIGGELNDKDEKAKVSRYWCLEYAEFEAVYKKKDVSSLKRFITAKEDTFRAPYARKEARHPRPSLFAGTTNETEILLDPTGDRRFWVLKVEIDKIPQAELIRERDKIWAAADSLYKKGERWDLTDQEERSRVDLNKEFRKTHFWEDIIEQLWLDSQPTKYITTEMIARGLGFESASSVKGYDLHTMKEVLERLGFTKVTKRINGVQSRSCWERKTFKVGLEEKPPVTDVTPVTSLATSGFETVTPSYDKEVAPVTGEVVKIETVMPVTPSCNKGVIPSNPVAPRVVTGVTGVTAAISENQKSEIENYIAPAINAELLRECISDQNWQMVASLTEDWDAEYKSEVWACLSDEEKQFLKYLKSSQVPPVTTSEPADYDQSKIPLLMENKIYFSVKEKSKIKVFVIAPDGKSVQCQIQVRGKGIYQIPFSDIRCCEESPYSQLVVGDKIKILLSGKRGVISSIIDADIYLKDDRNKSIKGSYMPHHLQKIE